MPLSQNLYPDLLLARILFSVGGASASCMLTAIIPLLTDQPLERMTSHQANDQTPVLPAVTGQTEQIEGPVASDSGQKASKNAPASTSQAAALVGVFSGLGALVALLVLLRLPSMFQHNGLDSAKALRVTYCITAALAVIISVKSLLHAYCIRSSSFSWAALLDFEMCTI